MAKKQPAVNEIDQALAEALSNRDETAKVLEEAKKLLAQLKRGAKEGIDARDAVVEAARKSDKKLAELKEIAEKQYAEFLEKRVEERAALTEFVYLMPPNKAAVTELSAEEVAVILDVSTRTVTRAKEVRDATPNKDEIPGFHMASIPYVHGAGKGTYAYLLLEIQLYTRRRYVRHSEDAEAVLKDFYQKNPTAKNLSMGVYEPTPNVLKFFENGLSDNTWPFSIQSDGTPVCIFEAIKRGILTGNARRLTIREYGGMLAKAASGRSARSVKDELEIEVPEVEVEPRKPSSPENPRKTGM